MTVIEFKPHSGNRRSPAPQRPCGSPSGQYTHNAKSPSPEVSPEASGRLGSLAIGVGVFALVGLFFWWVA